MAQAARPHSHSPQRCRALAAQLNDHLEGELPPDLCADLDAHLADAPTVRSYSNPLGKTAQIVP